MRPALDLRERLRLGLKVPVPFLAYLWFENRPEETAAGALVAFAAAVGALSLIELVWLPSSTQAERIFTKTRRSAVVLHVTTVLASAAALLYAVPRLP
jgi:hypothetical protein